RTVKNSVFVYEIFFGSYSLAFGTNMCLWKSVCRQCGELISIPRFPRHGQWQDLVQTELFFQPGFLDGGGTPLFFPVVNPGNNDRVIGKIHDGSGSEGRDELTWTKFAYFFSVGHHCSPFK